MSATTAASKWRALAPALALYLVWVLATYLLEGRVLTPELIEHEDWQLVTGGAVDGALGTRAVALRGNGEVQSGATRVGAARAVMGTGLSERRRFGGGFRQERHPYAGHRAHSAW